MKRVDGMLMRLTSVAKDFGEFAAKGSSARAGQMSWSRIWKTETGGHWAVSSPM